MLAEDDADLREVLADLIAQDGFRVRTVQSGTQLAACLQRLADGGEPPAAIVTDHSMPGRYVFDVLEAHATAVDSPPVIVITAFGDEVEPRAARFGAKAVFDKPFDPDDLRTAVLHWVTRPRARHQGSPCFR